MANFIDLDKLNKSIDKAQRGEKTPGMLIEGRNTDQTSSEIDNKIADSGIKETLGSETENSSMSTNRRKQIAGAVGDILKSQTRPSEANLMKMNTRLDVPKVDDVMAARRQALMQLLKR